MKLLWYEIKHCFHKNAVFAIGAMLMIGVLHSLIYLNLQYRTVKSDGELVYGLKAFRTYYEISKDLDGVLDDEYLQKLRNEYEKSYEKKFLAEIDRGFLSTGGMMKYIKTNYLLNIPRFGADMSNGNEKMDLSYDYLDSAKSFYRAYKNTVYEMLLTFREWSGFRAFAEEEKEILRKKVENIKIPFRIEDTWGFSNATSYLYLEFFIMAFMICFSLSSIFTKDGIHKMSDMELVTMRGRSYHITIRFLAGLIFTMIFTFLQIFVVYSVQGMIQGFDGWKAAVQLYKPCCILDITAGGAFLLWNIGMLCGLLVVAGITMSVSIITKKTKPAIVIASAILYFIMKQSGGYDKWRIFNPFYFKTFSSLEEYYPMFGTVVPYFMVILFLTGLYSFILYMLILFFGKKYRW